MQRSLRARKASAVAQTELDDAAERKGEAVAARAAAAERRRRTAEENGLTQTLVS